MSAIDTGNHRREQVRSYRCFLIRCRLDENEGLDDGLSWRFTVEEAGESGLRRNFATILDVETYLEAQLTAGRRRVAGRAP